MRLERSAGILLHPTSLPGRYGIGDLGGEAYNFVNFLEAAGQSVWQVLSLGPTGYGDSPYQCFSAFGGNHYLISPDLLIEQRLLSEEDVRPVPPCDRHRVDYGTVIEYKMELFAKAFAAFRATTDRSLKRSFDRFVREHRGWLDDYAAFMAIKEAHEGAHWSEWERPLIRREQTALTAWSKRVAGDILFHKFLQFEFFRQWHRLRAYANGKGIRIVGDLPIFVAYDSADVWANKELFSVDANGALLTQAGVPPDYFSATGQLWGNPLYRWRRMERDDFLWWRSRIGTLLEMTDILRIDHFRGFDAYWEIAGDAATAQVGRWVKAPGKKFFTTVREHLGDLPFIAEDLGVITDSVNELRDAFNFPGMKILQFAFGAGMERRFLPHNLHHNAVVYTGSHDNDTTRGYFEKARHEPNDIYASAQRYVNYYGDDMCFALIRAAYASVADVAVIPMQDILNLGTEARMNFPGTSEGNWAWRFSWDQIGERVTGTYRALAAIYERVPRK